MAKALEKSAQEILDEQVSQAPELPMDDPGDENPKMTKKEEKQVKALGIPQSRVTFAGYKEKSNQPKMEREMKRHEKLQAQRVKSRLEKAKAADLMKPIDKRKAVLVSRLRATRNEGKTLMRPGAYSDKNLKAWIEELELINKSPKSWNRQTKNGTLPYTPGNKKKRSTREILESMDLD